MPDVFGSGFTGKGNTHQTNYALVVGVGTLFPPQGLYLQQTPKTPRYWLWRQWMAHVRGPSQRIIDIGLGVSIGSKPMNDIGGIHRGAALVVTVKEKAYAILRPIRNLWSMP